MKRLFLIICCISTLLLGIGAANKGSINTSIPDIQKPGKKVSVDLNFGKTGLYFITNKGQVNNEALFYAGTTNYTLWVTKQGLVFDSIKTAEGKTKERDVSRLTFLNSRQNPVIVPENPTDYRVNYLKGNNPSGWYTDIPSSKRVCYHNLYNHIDLKVYGVEKEIEYDWIIKPGGNPSDILFDYEQIKKSFIDQTGNLVIQTAFGEWLHKKPVGYQVINGKRVPVEIGFTKVKKEKAAHVYGFKVSPYDKNYELIIDPMVIAFSTYLGGSGVDEVNNITIDGSGSIYATGCTQSYNFPTANAIQGYNAGSQDAFITKYSPDGSSLVYSTYLGGSSDDYSKAVAVDSNGAAYITGYTYSSDYPTMNAYQTFGGVEDAFIAKISANGSSLLYSTFLGGSNIDEAYDIVVNNSSEIYITGFTNSNDFPLQNALQTSFNVTEAFVTKFSASGSSLVFSTYLGGSDYDGAKTIDIDNSNNIYVGGYTQSNNFPTVNAYQPSLNASNDGFLVKIIPNGSALAFSTYLGGSYDEEIQDIDINSTGIYATGWTASDDFPTTPNAYHTTKEGYTDAFVSKFNLSGSSLVYSSYLCGKWGITKAYGIAAGADGSAYITGDTNSQEFPQVDPIEELTIYYSYPLAFVSRFLPDGSDISFSSLFGIPYSEPVGKGIQVDSAGNIYVGGVTSSGFPIYNAVQPNYGGYRDGFVMKIEPAQIRVISPNGNETLFTGNDYMIEWTAPEAIANVSIRYSSDNGENWTSIITSTPNTGSYSWHVPYVESNNCLISIADASQPLLLLSDTSDGVFSITDYSFRIKSPNGNEYWAGGSSHSITWDDIGGIANVSISYSNDSGGTWIPIVESIPNTGSYNWTVPEISSNSCLVKIDDASGWYGPDQSDNFFTIYPNTVSFLEITSPNDGEGWTVGTLHNITWSSNLIEEVNIDYSADCGETWIHITGPIANTGSYAWTVPPTPSQCSFMKVSQVGGTFSDTTFFTIKAPPLPQAERDALIALYNSTYGDYWGNNYNWRDPENPSLFNKQGTEYSWHGITLNADYTHVEKINLPCNSLWGTIPDLSALTELKELDLGSSYLEGNFPTTITSLTNLTNLDFSDCQIYGVLPDLSGLTNLVRLDLSFNTISGNIPSWLNSLNNLEYLFISNNSFNGEIPNLSGLTKLKELRIGGNTLSGGIPTWLNNLTYLETIEMSNANLSGPIPDLSNLSSLYDLNLSYNNLSGTIPSWISSLTGLLFLDLSNNEFSGSIPVELGQLTNLYNIYLAGNKLTGNIPSSLINLIYLYSNNLDIRWNGLHTTDEALRTFLNSKQIDGNWENTQTIAPAGISTSEISNTSVKLSWTPILYQGDTGGYRVYYSTTSGSNYILAGSTADKTVNNYTVNGLNPGTTYYFVVETFTNPHTYNDNVVISEYSTEVPAAILPLVITVNSPNGGESLEGATVHNITWTNEGSITNVKIEYSTDNGVSWNIITGSTANSGSYPWTVANTPSINCLVKVSDTASASSDQSNAVFTILAQRTITVTSPNGGESWEGNTAQAITWTNTGAVNNVKIEYSTDNGSSWNIITASTANTGSYNWTVPNTPFTNCLVKVSDIDGPAVDQSNAIFTILIQRTITLTSPNGGENLMGTLSSPISWISTGLIANVKIEYSADSGSSWNLIVDSTPNTGTYNWTVTNISSSNCLVKVSDIVGPASDLSNAMFTISPLITTGERETLIALYNSTNGDSWYNRDNWRKPGDSTQFNDPGTENTWFGVTLTVDGAHVEKVQLSGNNLTGTLPADLNNFQQLTTLDLSQNENLTGVIPGLGNLAQLRWLNISSCALSGSIPASLNNMANLKDLNLGYNALTGSMPDLSSLTNLENLDLSSNQLTGSIPAYLNSFTNILNINLNINSFSGPIPDLSNLTNLATLRLMSNQLNGTIPTWLNTLTDLTTIGLGSNQLTGTIPDLTALTQLVGLYLDNNQLSGSIPSWLNSLHTLKMVDLSNNQLTGTIPDLSNLTHLEWLKLSKNRLSGNIPENIGSLYNLTILYLEGNQLKGSIPVSIVNLESLYSDFMTQGLDIRWNGLYTNDFTVRNFVDYKNRGDWQEWENTQTIAPTNLSTGDITLDSIDLSWTPIPYQADTGEYQVYYSTTSGSGYILAGTTASKSVNNYTVTGLTQDTQYYFVIKTVTQPHTYNPNTITGDNSEEISAATLTPTITLTVPNGGESWEGNTSHAITWTNTGAITNVKIEYSTDNGNAWNTIIASTGNTGSYNWNVPNTPFTNCLVKVSDIDGPAVDQSNAVFTILTQRTITVSSPNGGESWEGNTAHAIAWTSTGAINNVKIEYSTDNGNVWNIITASTANAGTYNWTVPNTPFTNCLIKVSDIDGPAVDQSNAVFTILTQRTITVTSPNGGESWEGNTSHAITWTSTGAINNVKIEYSTDNGSSWNIIAASTANSGSYNWNVPNTPFTNCLIKVSDIDGPAVDQSNAVFAILIQRTITVSSPNGGESWEGNTAHAITWTSTGAINNVKIEYSTDNGSLWNIITASTANSGSYNWNVPNTPFTNCLVKVSDIDGPAVDQSNAVFTILIHRTITVTSPNGGESWEGNTAHAITWTYTGNIPNVMIEYSLNSGSSWNTITASTANTGSYNWPVPNSPSTTCMVKVSDAAGPASDQSNAVFTILTERTITVAAPNGSESWEGNTFHAITWTSTGDISNVKIEYSLNSGSSWNTISAAAANSGSYNWPVPNSPSTTCLVKVSDAAGPAFDQSNATFTIAAERTITVSSPNGGESWEGNTAHVIAWTSTGAINNVKIEYSTDNGNVWNIITASTANAGSYNWTVPNTPFTNCLVKVNDIDGPAVDQSNAVFTILIQRTITVTSPNGGESWEGNTAHAITWTYTGNIPNVMIEYSLNSGSSWNTISAAAANTGSYNWPVPNSPSTTCLVKVSDAAGSAFDQSNAVFTILAQRTITVTSPNGGESWEGNTVYPITWNSTGAISNVMIEYSTNNGSSWNIITASTSNTGSYNWNVPNTPFTNCLVKVSDIDGPAFDQSNAVFAIFTQRTITITSPNGAENLLVNTTYPITWTSTGAISSVMIEYSTNNGSSWNTVTASTSNTGSYNWTIPASGSTSCLVKVSDTSGPAFDQSNAVFTISNVTYCASSGTSQTRGSIARVQVGNLDNSSGSSAYTDFTSLIANLTTGSSTNITLTPSTTNNTEYWKIWIDYNRDGDFADSEENVYSGSGKTTKTGSFTVPSATAKGTSRMRVTMRYNSTPTYCDSFSYGEVEDYTVNIQ